MSSSHGRGWEEEAVIKQWIHHGRGREQDSGRRSAQWVGYHTETHLDCRVQPQPTPQRMSPDAACIDSQSYIKAKYPNMVTMTIPGLNKHKIDKREVIPSGTFKGLTPREGLLSFTKAKMAALILGSNDNWILTKNTSDSIQDYFKMLEGLFSGTCFKVLFLSTVFPRRSFYKNGTINQKLKSFNEALLAKHKNYIKISDANGATVLLTLRIVDMTSTFRYEEMDHPRFYCTRSKDGIHLKGVYSELYLENLFREITKYQVGAAKAIKSKTKPKKKLNGASST